MTIVQLLGLCIAPGHTRVLPVCVYSGHPASLLLVTSKL